LFTLFKTLISQKLSHQLSSNKLSVIMIRYFEFNQFIWSNLLVWVKSYQFSKRKCTFFWSEEVFYSRHIYTFHFNFFDAWVFNLDSYFPTHCILFYLGYPKQPWFSQAGSENACAFHMRNRNLANLAFRAQFHQRSTYSF